jgi:hypothetical protein
MENREAFVKRTVVIIGITMRTVIFLLPFVLYTALPVPGFRPDQFDTLLYILLPLTCLYYALFIKFIAQNRYQVAGRKLEDLPLNLGYFLLILLGIAELTLILWKAFDDTVLDDNKFFLLIALIESGFGIYAGLYLSDLFSRNANAA